MKAETLREFFVSSLFSSCVFGLMLQFMIIQQDLESTTNNILSLSETGEDANPHLPADTR